MQSDTKVHYLSKRYSWEILHKAGRASTCSANHGQALNCSKSAFVSLNPVLMLWQVGWMALPVRKMLFSAWGLTSPLQLWQWVSEPPRCLEVLGDFRVGAGREELSLLHLFPQNEGWGLAAGCEMGEKAAAYMLAVSFKIPSDLETWVSHPACLFWSDLLCWQRFAQFAQLWTTLASAHLLGVGAGLWGLSESWSWGLLCQGLVLAQNLSVVFYRWCWKGTASSHTAARHLKVNYMGPDPMSRLSERFLNGAVAWKHLVMIPLTKPTWARWLLRKNYLKGKKSVWSLQK